jgi:hypothetical protein
MDPHGTPVKARAVRFVEDGHSEQLPGSTPVVSKPFDMDYLDGTAVLVGTRRGQPVFHYVGNDGAVKEVELRVVPLGEYNGGDEVLVETGETDPHGNPRWKLSEVKI